jgi:hypothetical protein
VTYRESKTPLAASDTLAVLSRPVQQLHPLPATPEYERPQLHRVKAKLERYFDCAAARGRGIKRREGSFTQLDQ